MMKLEITRIELVDSISINFQWLDVLYVCFRSSQLNAGLKIVQKCFKNSYVFGVFCCFFFFFCRF